MLSEVKANDARRNVFIFVFYCIYSLPKIAVYLSTHISSPACLQPSPGFRLQAIICPVLAIKLFVITLI